MEHARHPTLEKDIQELMALVQEPDGNSQKLRSVLRVQELLSQYKPGTASNILHGLFQDPDRLEQHARTVLGRIKEVLPPLTIPHTETPEQHAERLKAFHLLEEISRIPGFSAVRALLEDYAFPEERPPVTARVIREIPKKSATPLGGKEPMCCPNIGG